MKKEFPEDFSEFVSGTRSSAINYYKGDVGKLKIVEWMEGDMDGVPYDCKNVRGCEHQIVVDTAKFCPECGKPTWIQEHTCCEDDMEFIVDDFYELFRCFNMLSYVYGEGFNALGLDYGSAPDDMTFGEFRAKANSVISKIVGKETKCQHICKDY